MDLVAKGFGFDVHAIFYPGQPVDNKGVWPGYINHHRGIDESPIFEGHSSHPTICLADITYLGIKNKLTAFGLGRPASGCEWPVEGR